MAAIQQNDFQIITGKVMEYAYMGEGNNPDDPVQLKPIIKSINSDRQIKYNRD